MSTLTVFANELKGSITPPPFKSEAIRLLILGALCGKRPESIIAPSAKLGDDILYAIRAVDEVFFSANEGDIVPVGDSAALIRLLAPILLIRSGRCRFRVGDTLIRRDMSGIGRSVGCSIIKKDDIIEFYADTPHSAQITVDASSSSQFASGFLIAAAYFKGLSIRVDAPVSQPYIELTLECIRRFGCELVRGDDGSYSSNGERLTFSNGFCIEPDMSYAAVFEAANYLQGFKAIEVIGVNERSKQADAAFSRLVEMNEFSVSDAPDIFPLLAVCSLKKQSDTHIHGTARLRGKESDRVESTSRLIQALGGSIDVFDDSVIVRGCGGGLSGGTVDSFSDHRIVMAAAVASLICSSPVSIVGAEAVSKSAPMFFDDFSALGGIVL